MRMDWAPGSDEASVSAATSFHHHSITTNATRTDHNRATTDEFVASSLLAAAAMGTTSTSPDLVITAQELYRDPLSVLITITVLYSIIFVVGIVGNFVTCFVISRNKSMHTATNYYLFNLAACDMLMLLSAMPPDLYNAWYPSQYPFGSAVCILQGLLAETSTNVTILTISCFTIERYIAICHPFRQHMSMSKLSRAIKFIIGIWICAITTALPQACQFGVVTIGDAVLCTIKNPTLSYGFEISSFIFFVSPMILICVLYILIGLKLRQSSRVIARFSHRESRPTSAGHLINHGGSGQNNNYSGKAKDSPLASPASSASYRQIAPHPSTTPKKSQRRIIKMLIAVVVAFFLCWAPFHAQRLLTVYGSTVDNTPKNQTFYVVYTVLTHISGVTFFLSTCINPLLYSVMSHKFRNAFKTTIGSTCFKFNWKKRWSSRTTAGMTTSTDNGQQHQQQHHQQEMVVPRRNANALP